MIQHDFMSQQGLHCFGGALGNPCALDSTLLLTDRGNSEGSETAAGKHKAGKERNARAGAEKLAIIASLATWCQGDG